MKDLNPKDRRVLRTRNNLRQALYRLIEEKSYTQITVKDILVRANVGRATFYNHFRDKDDLLLSAIPDNIMEVEIVADTMQINMASLFTRAQANPPLFKALLGSGGIGLFFEQTQRRLMRQLQTNLEALEDKGREFSLPVSILACYLSGAATALFRQWLDDGMPHTPTEMDAMIGQLIEKAVS